MDRPAITTRGIAVALAALLAVVASVVVVAIPDGDPPPRALGVDDTAADAAPADAAVVVTLGIDTVDATRATLRTRVLAVPGPALPTGGALVATDVGALPTVAVRAAGVDPESSIELVAEAGEVTAYPFDTYVATLELLAVADADRTLDTLAGAPPLPLAVTGSTTAPGFTVTGSAASGPEGTTLVTVRAERERNARAWAVVMMAINWLLAAAAIGVAASVALGQRQWETRHLAWLGSMLFALAAFRTTAPGNPPIGTFLDFAAFFPAFALVAAALLALVGVYLLRPRERLGL